MVEQEITGNDNIQETVMKHPETIDVFMTYGLHCVGCHISASESIAEGAYGHGMDDDAVHSLVSDINEAIKDHTSSFELKITHKAVNKIYELMENEGKPNRELRITVKKQDDNLVYDFDFELHSMKDDDRVFEFFGLKVFVSPKSFALLSGTKIDYISNDFEDGFRIQNPQDSHSFQDEKIGCGC